MSIRSFYFSPTFPSCCVLLFFPDPLRMSLPYPKSIRKESPALIHHFPESLQPVPIPSSYPPPHPSHIFGDPPFFVENTEIKPPSILRIGHKQSSGWVFPKNRWYTEDPFAKDPGCRVCNKKGGKYPSVTKVFPFPGKKIFSWISRLRVGFFVLFQIRLLYRRRGGLQLLKDLSLLRAPRSPQSEVCVRRGKGLEAETGRVPLLFGGGSNLAALFLRV